MDEIPPTAPHNARSDWASVDAALESAAEDLHAGMAEDVGFLAGSVRQSLMLSDARPSSDKVVFEGIVKRIHNAAPIGTDRRTTGQGHPAFLGGGTRMVWPAAIGIAFFVAATTGIQWWWRHEMAAVPRAFATYTTGLGQRATVRLPDGSRAILAPRTTLVVDRAFGRVARRVALNGEAYFEVAGGTYRTPFLVQAGATTTQVLGTAFDVMHYANVPDVRIVVAVGRVQARTNGRAPVILAAGTVGKFQDSTAALTTMTDVSAYTGWTKGHLEFRHTPLPDVLSTLEQWYGVRFRVADAAVSSAHVDGRLDFDSVAEVVSALKAMLDVSATYDRAGDTTIVTLHARRSSVPAKPATPIRRDGMSFNSPQSEIGK